MQMGLIFAFRLRFGAAPVALQARGGSELAGLQQRRSSGAGGQTHHSLRLRISKGQ